MEWGGEIYIGYLIGEIIFCAGLVRQERSLVFNTEERFRFVGPAQNITVIFCAGPTKRKRSSVLKTRERPRLTSPAQNIISPITMDISTFHFRDVIGEIIFCAGLSRKGSVYWP